MRSPGWRHRFLTIVALGGSAIIHTGCGTIQRSEAMLSDLTPATPIREVEADKGPEPTPAMAALVGPEDADIQAALTAWKESGQAPIIRTDEFIQYPYGLTEAVVTCQPLRVCDIELETGEEVLNVSIGDSTRWLASPAFSGDRDLVTPHVLVKPTEFGIATNAVVTTTRRTYYLALVSPARAGLPHARRVKFYYPQDLLQRANGAFRAQATERKREETMTVARLSRLAVESLDFDYEIDGGNVPWKPIRVFDDGTHVYIQMSEAMRVTEAPALLVQTRAGDAALVNYRLRERFYIVDKLFDTALLVVGVGPHQERITIRRRGAPRVEATR